MNRYIVVLLLVFSWPMAAQAQCTNPSGEMGVIIFNKAYKVMQYCNGDAWVGLRGSSGGETENGGGVPPGAVMAFNLTGCPDGWGEYTPARGRFIRGIDNGAGNDPAGTRAPGNVQADELKSHSHSVYRNISGGTLHDVFHFYDEYRGNGSGVGTSATGGAETRPKNVALLYCEKQ